MKNSILNKITEEGEVWFYHEKGTKNDILNTEEISYLESIMSKGDGYYDMDGNSVSKSYEAVSIEVEDYKLSIEGEI